MQLKYASSLHNKRDKFALAAIIASVFFSIIVFRLIQLQLVHGKQYKLFSEKNRITEKKIYALRGKILDRNGGILVDNRPSFDLTLTRGYFERQQGPVYDFLRNDLGLSEEQIAEIDNKLERTPRFEAATVLEDIDWEIIAKTKAKSYAFPGVDIAYRPMRLYPHKKLACHILGYLREVSKTRLERLQKQKIEGLTLGDYNGVWGIEQQLDRELRGVNGRRPVIEDAFGRELGEASSDFLLPTLRRKDAIPGFNVYLTIDYNLQKVAEDAFGDQAGAAIAMDPRSGEILAMVSKPCFDLSKFSRNIPQDYWKEINNDPLVPLYDRATMGIYPPGSTFKMITASAGLRAGIAQSAKTAHYQTCKGSYRIGRETKRCWKPFPGHGYVEVTGAITRSCDVYFYQLGLELGVDAIAEEARLFGLGERTRIGINREQAGNVPTEAWKQRVYNERWVGGETASVSIGQGYLTTTPLQMARVAAALANNGQVVKPRLISHTKNIQTQEINNYPTEIVGDVGIAPENLELIVRGMDNAVNTKDGTAYWRGRSTKYRIAGKTGTAQVVRQRAGEKASATRFEDHAWFIAFAPIEDPRIAVAILVENGGHGSTAAAPIARQIIETHLDPPAPLEEPKLKAPVKLDEFEKPPEPLQTPVLPTAEIETNGT